MYVATYSFHGFDFAVLWMMLIVKYILMNIFQIKKKIITDVLE